MNVEALKEKARRHEQREEWQKALDAYQEVLRKHDEDEPPDIALYNRVGDIQIRVGQVEGAVKSYEQAIELYMEAELPNNAIAVCKKVLRNLPDRSVFFLRMGQIRGSQGFLTDARQNFLTYAERQTEEGDLDSALDALIEFVSLAPEDLEIRLGLAAQLESRERVEEAVEQYADAYKRLILQGQEADAESIAEKVRELSPDTMLPDPQSILAGAGAEEEEGAFVLGSGLPGIEMDSGPVDDEPSALEKAEMEDEVRYGEVLLGGEEEVGPEEEVEPGPALDLEGGVGDVGEEEEEAEAFPTFGFQEEEDEEEGAEALPTFGFQEEEDEEEGAEALPTFGFDEEEEGEVQGLPTLDLGDEEEEEELEPLPTFGFDEGVEDVEEVTTVLGATEFGETDRGDPVEEVFTEAGEAFPELEAEPEGLTTGGEEEIPEDAVAPTSEEAMEEAVEEAAAEAAEARGLPATHEEAAEQGDLELAMKLVDAQIALHADAVDLHQRKVEYAFRQGERDVLVGAYMDLAGCLIRTQQPAKARAIYQQVLSLAPGHQGAVEGLEEMEGASTDRRPAEVASSEEYVDLGSMILGSEPEKTTRWQVTADAPSGDEQADFAKMLSQFKQKVSEHVDADDVKAHHDLGTAYMEMGLYEEAISEFQMALRASPNHLPTFEMMGRCWMEHSQPDMAARALHRALEVEYDVEDELIGIYYLMGRAQEELGNPEDAVEFYEKVFSLDINFEDVTERLRTLR